jgi:C-terminal processing protease CtpA/Prc
LAVLKRLDLIVDSRQGLAYVRPRNTPPLAGPHNRLGAVFVPSKTHPDELVAQVVVESPAWQAGVRNGDCLLEVDGQAVTLVTLKPFLMQRAGTKLQLTLKRGSERLMTTVVLREILAPEKGAAGSNQTASVSWLRNPSIQRTGASRSAQFVLPAQWRLAPAADADRWARTASG